MDEAWEAMVARASRAWTNDEVAAQLAMNPGLPPDVDAEHAETMVRWWMRRCLAHGVVPSERPWLDVHAPAR